MELKKPILDAFPNDVAYYQGEPYAVLSEQGRNVLLDDPNGEGYLVVDISELSDKPTPPPSKSPMKSGKLAARYPLNIFVNASDVYNNPPYPNMDVNRWNRAIDTTRSAKGDRFVVASVFATYKKIK